MFLFLTRFFFLLRFNSLQEEPFSILPMEKMCQGSIRVPVMDQVERSIEVLEQQQQQSQPPRQQPQPKAFASMDPSYSEPPKLAGLSPTTNPPNDNRPTYTISRVSLDGEYVNGSFINGAGNSHGDAGQGI